MTYSISSSSGEQPPAAFSWLIRFSQVRWLNQEHLPRTPAVIVAADADLPLLSAALKQLSLGIPYERIGLSAKDDQSLRAAMEVARSKQLPLIPIALAAAPSFVLSFPKVLRLPLPQSRIVISVEVPFEVPDQPTSIPDTWVQAVQQQLKQASGRAIDSLASWRRASI